MSASTHPSIAIAVEEREDEAGQWLVTPLVLEQLRRAGMTTVVVDIRELLSPGASLRLERNGFDREPRCDGALVYVRGKPLMGHAGQRAVFEPGGKVLLSSFAPATEGRPALMQIIIRPPKGAIRSVVKRFK